MRRLLLATMMTLFVLFVGAKCEPPPCKPVGTCWFATPKSFVVTQTCATFFCEDAIAKYYYYCCDESPVLSNNSKGE